MLSYSQLSHLGFSVCINLEFSVSIFVNHPYAFYVLELGIVFSTTTPNELLKYAPNKAQNKCLFSQIWYSEDVQHAFFLQESLHLYLNKGNNNGL